MLNLRSPEGPRELRFRLVRTCSLPCEHTHWEAGGSEPCWSTDAHTGGCSPPAWVSSGFLQFFTAQLKTLKRHTLTLFSCSGMCPYWHCQWPHSKVALQILTWHTTGASFLILLRGRLSDDCCYPIPSPNKRGWFFFYWFHILPFFPHKIMHLTAIEERKWSRVLALQSLSCSHPCGFIFS